MRNQKSKLRLAQLELDRKFNSKNFWFSSIWYPIYGKIFLEKVAIIARLFPRAKGDIPGAIAVSVSVSPPGPTRHLIPFPDRPDPLSSLTEVLSWIPARTVGVSNYIQLDAIINPWLVKKKPPPL